MDSSTITTSSLARNFPAALNILADVALRSTFPAEEVERIRAARLADVVQQRSNPNIIATNVTSAALYGLEHPYGFAQLGTADSIKRVTRDDLHGFWRSQFVPGNAALVVAGSITLPELRKLAEIDVRELAARDSHACEARRLRACATAPGARRSSGLTADAAPCRDDRRAAIES